MCCDDAVYSAHNVHKETSIDNSKIKDFFIWNSPLFYDIIEQNGIWHLSSFQNEIIDVLKHATEE